MAEPGSLADRIKQQADIVRVIGEYVRLKKSGQNYLGLCPFHQEKTPSFAVHPVKQIYHCFGCGAGGDVFRFVMEMEKCSFPEAVRIVAEKCGLPVPAQRGRPGGGSGSGELRRALLAVHQEAAEFFARQMRETTEGRVAQAYLEDRGLQPETFRRFGLGYAPAAGDALYRQLRRRFPPTVLESSGLFVRDGTLWLDRFRRRIMFPLSTEQGRVVAFAGRALGDEQPKYLNSPETPIYSKSRLLYNLDRAREAIRREGYAILVEGYMDVIALVEAGLEPVVASCGTSLSEAQVRLLGRYARRLVVNFDRDAAGQAATERSLALLLGSDFDVRVLVLPAGSGEKTDPDSFVRSQGSVAYRDLLARAPRYLEYLIQRARQMASGGIEGRLQAVNFLLPYLRHLPSRLARLEWASRAASELGIEFTVLREALREAAGEGRTRVELPPALVGARITPVERRLMRLLLEAEDSVRRRLARQLLEEELHRGLETESLLEKLLPAVAAGTDAAGLLEQASVWESKQRELLFELAFEAGPPTSLEEVEACLGVLRRRRLEGELQRLQEEIRRLEQQPEATVQREHLRLLDRVRALRRALEGQ
jgi:DNA primase